jgi:ribonuclease P protein component
LAVLPQQNRIKISRDFSTVYRHGEKAVSRHLVVRVLSLRQGAQSQAEPFFSSGATQPAARIGITVSQKVSKRAVIRNRLKRRVRAAMRTLLPRLQPGVWIVINLRPEATQCEYGEILRELEQLLTKLEVIHGHS